MNKTLTITPPKEYEIDKENSTFEQIVFKQVEEKKWDREERTKANNAYWFLTRSKEVGFTVEYGVWSHILTAHTYSTKELAESEAHIFRTMQLMRNWARFHNELDGFIPDWNNSDSPKWGMLYTDGEIQSELSYFTNPFIFGVAVFSRERADQMLQEFREDLEKIEW